MWVNIYLHSFIGNRPLAKIFIEISSQPVLWIEDGKLITQSCPTSLPSFLYPKIEIGEQRSGKKH